MRVDVANLQQVYEKNRQHFVTAGQYFSQFCLVLLLSYTVASILNVFTMVIIMSGYQMPSATAAMGTDSAPVDLDNLPNYNPILEAILARNIFNSSGEYPQESSGEKSRAGQFDPDAICEKTTLPHKLQGMVYMNTPDSLIVLQDPTYSEGDVYRAGDNIIDQDGVSVHAIERYSVILNNNGRKECIDVPKTIQVENEMGNDPGDFGGGGGGGDMGGGGEPQVFELMASEVEQSMGAGGGKIADLIQVIPVEGRGYKVLRVRQGTLFFKAGLRNEDILKNVNGKNMLDLANGSALLESMQEDREIRVELERAGQPRTVIIRIR